VDAPYAVPNKQLLHSALGIAVAAYEPSSILVHLHCRRWQTLMFPEPICVCDWQLMEEQPEDASLQQMQPSYEPPTPPEPPLTVALLVGGPGTAAARLESFRAAVGLAQVRA
jgi:hypothetical protein